MRRCGLGEGGLVRFNLHAEGEGAESDVGVPAGNAFGNPLEGRASGIDGEICRKRFPILHLAWQASCIITAVVISRS